jgi:hypothetical protein
MMDGQSVAAAYEPEDLESLCIERLVELNELCGGRRGAQGRLLLAIVGRSAHVVHGCLSLDDCAGSNYGCE